MLNESNGGLGNSGYCHSDERKQKISLAMKDKSAGERNHRAMLTAEQVEQIRKLRESHSLSQLIIMFDDSTYCIWSIVKKINWLNRN